MPLSKLMIKFVYFDVGGVVIKDFSGTNKWEKFRKDFNISEEFWKTHYEKRLDKGDISAESHIPYKELIDGFVSKFEQNKSIWPIIKNLQNNVMVGLLTNMYPGMFQEIINHNLLPPIEWDTIIDSSIEKVAKPNKEIFELAQQKAGVKAEEILFIENTQKNLEIPKEMGWQTFYYDSKDYFKSTEELKTYFFQIGLF